MIAIAAILGGVPGCERTEAPLDGRDALTERPADDPALPRVLLVGDSISIGYTLQLRDALRGEANLHRIPRNAGATSRAISELTGWLEGGPWDLVYFNFGLWDVIRVPPDAPPATPLGEYTTNLEAIVERLAATGAALVWAATTPVPEATPAIRNADIERYNARAAEVMRARGVAIDDLYAALGAQRETITQGRSDVHLSEAGGRIVAEHVAETIRGALAAGAR